MNNQNFLLDKNFLKKLDIQQRREVYARVTSLSFDEQPVEQIEGLITTGSVNVDGTSSIRRTCSLTMISDQLNLKDYNWAIKTKFRLEVGLRNEIDDRYPDICWFPLGLYVITSFTSSIQANSRSISIQGKDKMCLLTGDLGGNLPSIIDFGREEWYDYDYERVFIESNTIYNQQKKNLYIKYNDPETKIKAYKNVMEFDPVPAYSPTQTYYKRAEIFTIVNNLTAEKYNYNSNESYYIQQRNNDTEQYEYILASGVFDATKTYYQKTVSQVYHIASLTIQKIIKEAIHTWAREPYNNIIINDLDTYGLEQMIYNSHSNVPMYIIKNTINNTFNITLDGSQEVYLAANNLTTLSDLSIENGFIFDTGIINPTKVSYKSNYTDNYYTVLKVNDTDDCGYRITDLTYTPEDGLICTVGEALSSILDKIKNMLGDFEYFYNLEGQFVFQRKPASANVNLSAVHNIDLQNLYVDAAALLNRVEYDFTDNYLISAINLNPTLNNVKNDYAIQGQRTTASGAQVPIRLRYAIDKKPTYYKAIDGKIYLSNEIYNNSSEEINQNTRKLKQIDNNGQITEVDEQTINTWKAAVWQRIITYINNIPEHYPAGENEPENTFWDLHHNSWWTTENGNFDRSNGLIKSYTVDSINHNIKYKAGWWDLEAWAKFYKVVTDKEANNNLVLYSGHKLKLNQTSKKWKDLGVFGYTTGSNLHYWVSPNGNGTAAHPINEEDRVFILIVNRHSHGRGNEVATIMPMNTKRSTDTLYKTTYNNNTITGSEKVNPTTAISYSYPEIFSILPSWTCDYAVDTLIRSYDDGGEGVDRMAWIYNPQFPEGSFQAAFEEGVRNYGLNNQEFFLFYGDDVQLVDWREIIYQMSKDYLKYAMSDTIVTTEEFERIFGNDWWPYGYENGSRIPITDIPINKRLAWRDIFTYTIKQLNSQQYPTGITGYEQYYTDINAFWRTIYNPDVQQTITRFDIDTENENWQSDFFFSTDDYDGIKAANGWTDEEAEQILGSLYRSDELRGWNYKLYYNPTALDFWFDFLEDGEIADKYSVKQIGLRTKAVNNDKIKAVYFTKVPLICYYTADGTEGWKDKTDDQVIKEGGYSFISLPTGMEKYFTISSRGISAKDELDNLLYQFSYVPENITLTSLPIYYLEPNTRIYVHDDESQIDGEYIMTKFTLPLTHNGTMSITANKAPERII